MTDLPVSVSAASPGVAMDPVSLLTHARGPILAVNAALLAAAGAVWVVAILKALQIARLSSAERRFEAAAEQATSAGELFAVSIQMPGAPGARVVREMGKRSGDAAWLESVAKRALVTEEERAGSMLSLLSTVASVAPFVGLFGTVWGILEAFLRIGQEKSASLPVVAPAIGEALVSTAVGLFAAIPAVILYNALAKRAEDHVARLTAASESWVLLVSGAAQHRVVVDRRFERETAVDKRGRGRRESSAPSPNIDLTPRPASIAGVS